MKTGTHVTNFTSFRTLMTLRIRKIFATLMALALSFAEEEAKLTGLASSFEHCCNTNKNLSQAQASSYIEMSGSTMY
jgi:hypothetical protein